MAKLETKLLLVVNFLQRGENLRLEYKLLTKTFRSLIPDRLRFPSSSQKRRRDNSAALICTYELGNDGYLYVKDMVKVATRKKSLRKGETSVYQCLFR